MIFMAESLETILGAGVLVTSGVIMAGAGYMLETSSESGYKVGIAIGAAGFAVTWPLMYLGSYLVSNVIEKK